MGVRPSGGQKPIARPVWLPSKHAKMRADLWRGMVLSPIERSFVQDVLNSELEPIVVVAREEKCKTRVNTEPLKEAAPDKTDDVRKRTIRNRRERERRGDSSQARVGVGGRLYLVFFLFNVSSIITKPFLTPSSPSPPRLRRWRPRNFQRYCTPPTSS